MNAYLSDLAGKPKFGADTYWGGKDILRYGQCALMAKQINSPTYQTFVDGLRGAMADWFTYRPGKADHFLAVIYYQAHAMRNLGAIDWTCHGSSPTSMVYKSGAGKADSYIVWNPTPRPETVTFYNGAMPIGAMLAAPQTLTRVEKLSPAK